MVRLLQLTFNDELKEVGRPVGLPGDLGYRALLHLVESDRRNLASYDDGMKDSILWDDMGTEVLEGRDDRIVTALLDVVDWLGVELGDNRDDWRWGLVHTLRLEPLLAGLGQGAMPSSSDKKFPRGFPRHGDLFAIDASSYVASSSLSAESFTYAAGPVMRWVVQLGPNGPKARVAISGDQGTGLGAVTLGEELEYWRNNLSHELPYGLDAVVASAKYRTVLSD
jgi:penicillin amidase